MGLTWAPPTLGGSGITIVDFTLTDATRASATLGAGTATQDLRITQTQAVTSGALAVIKGYRHVQWIGGEINLAGALWPQDGIILDTISGTVHLEGLWLHGGGILDGIVSRRGLAGHIIQVENCRIEVVSTDHVNQHSDGFQAQGTVISGLRFDTNTIKTDMHGIFMRNAYATLAGSAIENVDIRNTNFRGNSTLDYALWQQWEDHNHIGGGDPWPDGVTGTDAITPVSLTNVWAAEGSSGTIGSWVFPTKLFQDGFGGGTASMKRGCTEATDATSQYVAFSNGTGTVIAGGNHSGQATLDCQINGIIRSGVPSSGDFVSSTPPGISYISPGYGGGGGGHLSYSATVLADSPVAYWRLGTGSTDVNDSSGNGHTLTKTGTPTEVAGLIVQDADSARSFPGLNTTRYDAAAASVFDMLVNQAFTIEMWVNLSSVAAAFNRILGHEDGTNGWNVEAHSTNGFMFNRLAAGVTNSVNFLPAAGMTGITYHVVCTYDGTNLRMYLNGSLVAGPTASSGSVATNANTVRTGAFTGSAYAAGTFDEIAIYTTALSQAQVTTHYNAGSQATVVSGSGWAMRSRLARIRGRR